MRARQERNLGLKFLHFLKRLQHGMLKSDAPVLSHSSLFLSFSHGVFRKSIANLLQKHFFDPRNWSILSRTSFSGTFHKTPPPQAKLETTPLTPIGKCRAYGNLCHWEHDTNYFLCPPLRTPGGLLFLATRPPRIFSPPEPCKPRETRRKASDHEISPNLILRPLNTTLSSQPKKP